MLLKGNQRPFLFSESREQVQNERVHVRAKLSDKEREAMGH
jgi:hypothetical protein